MTEPRRLLSSGSDASALERSLLNAGRARREPEGMRDRVLAGIAAGAAGAALGVATHGTAAKISTAPAAKVATAVVTTKLKALIATAAVIATAGVTAYVATRPAHQAPVPAMAAAPPTASIPPSPAPPPSAAPTTITPSDLPTAPSARTPSAPRPISHAERLREEVTQVSDLGHYAAEAPGAARSPAHEAAESVSALREEAKLVDAARTALAAGDPASARARLDEAKTRYPQGRLGEEREALEIRVLAASGETSRAASLARAFLVRHPSSPLRPSIEAIAKK